VKFVAVREALILTALACLLPQFLPNWSPGKKVVVYCSAASCNAARDVAKRLRDEAQLKDVFVLQGGWEEWVKKSK
jgi:rhodanese-related sulfurtransferase